MTRNPERNIFVIGNGAWGTALAAAFASAGQNVTLWGRTAKAAPEGVTATDELSGIATSDYALLVIPAQNTRQMLEQLQPYLNPPTTLILCSKGLELDTGLRQSEIVQAVLFNHAYGVLSGPNFASEVIKGLPAATVLAAPKLSDAETYARDLAAPNLRPYAQDDVAGVELAGALKNILAIGAGIVAGAGLGENARAALITRGLAEITRLGIACGAKPATFAGLAGIGDVMLTCSSTQSRNFSYGFAVGAGQTPDTSHTVEGLPTIKAALKLAEAHTIDMPIASALNELIYNNKPLADVLSALQMRPLKNEVH